MTALTLTHLKEKSRYTFKSIVSNFSSLLDPYIYSLICIQYWICDHSVWWPKTSKNKSLKICKFAIFAKKEKHFPKFLISLACQPMKYLDYNELKFRIFNRQVAINISINKICEIYNIRHRINSRCNGSKVREHFLFNNDGEF